MAAVKLVRAAGGVVWRPANGSGGGTGPAGGGPIGSGSVGSGSVGSGPVGGGPAGGVELVVVHRQRYDDWSLPKGKLFDGEHVLAAAVREVREESGVVAAPQVRLPSIRYLTGDPDIEKAVDWWSMRAVSVSPHSALDEVDEVRWVDVPTAEGLLTYAHDRGIVATFAALRPVDGVAVVVRHAKAGKRGEWDGPDDERPLDAGGKRQAAALAPLLASFKPVRVYAAPLVRCVDTVAQVGLPVRAETVFAEETAASPKAVADRIRSLVAECGRVVIASQGGVIPAALAALRPPNAPATATFHTPKGDAWVVSFAGTDVVAADPLPPV